VWEILSQVERPVADYNTIVAEVRAHQDQIAKERAALGALRTRLINMREPAKEWDDRVWKMGFRSEVPREARANAERQIQTNSSGSSLNSGRSPKGASREDREAIRESSGCPCRWSNRTSHMQRAAYIQNALSAICGFDRTYPSLLERGLRWPTVCMLLRLSSALEVRPEQLLTDTVTRLRGNELAPEVVPNECRSRGARVYREIGIKKLTKPPNR
jgi:hypothetical protein